MDLPFWKVMSFLVCLQTATVWMLNTKTNEVAQFLNVNPK